MNPDTGAENGPPPDPQVMLGNAVVQLGNQSGWLYYDATTTPPTIYPSAVGGMASATILSAAATIPGEGPVGSGTMTG